ncbi:MAG: CHAT domain-containing protein, partial [Cyanobacteriota bacterium]|nr:CHAT domain-containing protein [Cyanobacteriota bacterium]
GIFSQGEVAVAGSSISDNFAEQRGGGIYSDRAVAVSRSTIDRNRTNRLGGGGIFSQGEVEVTDSSMFNNTAAGFGGGLASLGTVRLTRSILSDNIADKRGGGIWSDRAAIVTDSTLSGNIARGTVGGGFSGEGGGAIASEVAVTVTGSTISGNSASVGGGGGIYSSGTMTVTGSTISGNAAGEEGGGLASLGTVTVTDSTISDNTVGNNGGGIFSQDEVTLSNSTLSDNTARRGGGIFSYDAVRVNNSTISGNRSNNRGGGIYSQGEVAVTESEILSNLAGSDGGGIYSRGEVTTTNSTISENSGDDGGGIYSQSEVTATNSTISGNRADDNGGGIFSRREITVTSSTISGNRANNNGGGIFSQGGGEIANSTITENRADANGSGTGNGGGIFGSSNGMIASIVRNTILAGNIDPGGEAPDAGAGGTGTVSFNSNARNLVGSTAGFSGTLGTGSDIVNPDPGLAPLGDYGGSTQTHALLPDSPALDAGDNVMLPPTDQRGAPRIFNGTVDIGAFESAGFSLTLFDGDNQSTTVDTAFARALQVQLTENLTNRPIAGANIIFAPPATGASGNFSIGNTVATNANGIATANPLTANTLAGNYSIAASTGNLAPVTFDLANVPDIPNRLEIVGGNNQSTLVTTPFANPLSVRVSDRFGNPIPNLAINFNAPATGASGRFDNRNFITDPDGILSLGFTANGIDGRYQVVAEGVGLSPVSFDLTNEPVPSNFNPLQLQENEPIEVEKPLDFNPVELVNLSTSDAKIAEVEERFTPLFENYFGLEETSTANLEQAQQTLQNIAAETGVKPTLIYAFFVPTRTPTSEGHPSQTRPSSATEERVNFVPQPSDRLELVLVSASKRPLRYAVEVTREQILQDVKALQSTVTNVGRRRGYLAPAQQMYRWLIAPLEEDLKELNINNLVFILDSGLRSLPLAAMHDGTGFIVERYSVGLMPSLSLTDTNYVSLRDRSVLAMGAETFAEQSDLPAVPTELDAIARRIWQGEAFLNENFTLANLQAARSQRSYRIIHLATHGEFRAGSPENSYIQLWGDERLNLEQLRSLGWHQPPPVELLVLSACRTALGDEEAELGFAGLAAIAGVKTAMGSLWSVSDEGTLGLMTTFYEQLREAPIKAEALRRAQVAMLRGEARIENGMLVTPGQNFPLPPEWEGARHNNFRHPYYWSGFTMIGSPW